MKKILNAIKAVIITVIILAGVGLCSYYSYVLVVAVFPEISLGDASTALKGLVGFLLIMLLTMVLVFIRALYYLVSETIES